MPIKPRFSADYYVKGILEKNRVVLAQAITIVESALTTDQILASNILEQILSKTGNSIRIGITGIPGVGKSTFIERLGKLITNENHKVAVLSVDPSSQITKGSILGDKTRMEELSKNPNVFVRPTASGNTLGGVSGRTREAILLCEAAGYSVIIIETVGVGQSEVAIKNMVDFFLLLMLAGAGDELQGIKKGIMEMADALVITKADGDNIKHTLEAQTAYQQALHLFPVTESGWQTQVLTSSALTGSGVSDVWRMIEKYTEEAKASGYFTKIRSAQNVSWFHEHFDQLLKTEISLHDGMKEIISNLEKSVQQGSISSYAAARQLLQAYQATRGIKS